VRKRDGTAAVASFSLAVLVYFRRVHGSARHEREKRERRPSKLACGIRGLRKTTAERPRDDEKLETRSGSYVEIALESSRARHCAAMLARRRARPVPRQIRELKNTPFHARRRWKRARAPAYRFRLRPRGCGRDLGSDLELFRVRRELALLRLITCARSPDSERVAILERHPALDSTFVEFAVLTQRSWKGGKSDDVSVSRPFVGSRRAIIRRGAFYSWIVE
jgi:hypothetical protein